MVGARFRDLAVRLHVYAVDKHSRMQAYESEVRFMSGKDDSKGLRVYARSAVQVCVESVNLNLGARDVRGTEELDALYCCHYA